MFFINTVVSVQLIDKFDSFSNMLTLSLQTLIPSSCFGFPLLFLLVLNFPLLFIKNSVVFIAASQIIEFWIVCSYQQDFIYRTLVQFVLVMFLCREYLCLFLPSTLGHNQPGMTLLVSHLGFPGKGNVNSKHRLLKRKICCYMYSRKIAFLSLILSPGETSFLIIFLCKKADFSSLFL